MLRKRVMLSTLGNLELKQYYRFPPMAGKGQKERVVPRGKWPVAHFPSDNRLDEQYWSGTSVENHQSLTVAYRELLDDVYQLTIGFFFQKVLPRPFFSLILEFGSGTGLLTRNIPPEYAQGYHALEINPDTARMTQLYCGSVRVGSIYEPPYQPETFDAVVGLNAADSLFFLSQALGKIFNVLRRGGCFLHLQDVYPALKPALGRQYGNNNYALCVATDTKPDEATIRADFENNRVLSMYGGENIYFREGKSPFHRSAEFHESLVSSAQKAGFRVDDGTYHLRTLIPAPGLRQPMELFFERGHLMPRANPDVPESFLLVDYVGEFVVGEKPA